MRLRQSESLSEAENTANTVSKLDSENKFRLVRARVKSRVRDRNKQVRVGRTTCGKSRHPPRTRRGRRGASGVISPNTGSYVHRSLSMWLKFEIPCARKGPLTAHCSKLGLSSSFGSSPLLSLPAPDSTGNADSNNSLAAC